MEILHFEDLGDTKVSSMNAVWVLYNLVIDNLFYVASDTSPLCDRYRELRYNNRNKTRLQFECQAMHCLY